MRKYKLTPFQFIDKGFQAVWAIHPILRPFRMQVQRMLRRGLGRRVYVKRELWPSITSWRGRK